MNKLSSVQICTTAAIHDRRDDGKHPENHPGYFEFSLPRLWRF